MVEEELGPDGLPFSSPSRPEEDYAAFSPEKAGSSRLRRDTSGSTSSIDDWSGSATSSTSLRSLARNSSEYHHRPNFVTIRGEFGDYDLDEEDEPETPSRRLFPSSETAAEHILEMPSKGCTPSPGTSPLVGRSGSSKTAIEKEISPLQAFLMARTPSDGTHRSGTSPSPAKSPLSFLPRLLSSTKSAFKREPNSPLCRNQSVRALDFASIKKEPQLQHVESLKSARSGVVKASKDTTRHQGPLGYTAPTNQNQAARFLQSPSSDSNDDISPSKPPVTNTSNPSTLSTSTNSQSPLGPARAAVIARRKTIIGNNNKKSAPATIAARKPIRPQMRRGVTEPNPYLLSPGYATMMTPPTLFADVRPSPAAFASTGLVKKKSNIPGLEIPRFGESEPKRAKPIISPVKPVKSRLAEMTMGTEHSASTTSGASTSDGSVSVYVRNAQKTRGLRRKTSAMFASGSNGSIVDTKSPATSPLTPTKPNGLKGEFTCHVATLQCVLMTVAPLGLGISTPSPTTPTSFDYPFAPSSSMSTIASSPLTRFDHPPSDATEVSPSSDKVLKLSRPHLLRTKPIARASNPMLAATFQAQGTHGGRPHFAGPGNMINSDFVIMEILGQGEFSTVWKVKEKKSGQLFAVKAGRPYTGKKNR